MRANRIGFILILLGFFLAVYFGSVDEIDCIKAGRIHLLGMVMNALTDVDNGFPCDICKDLDTEWPSGTSTQMLVERFGRPQSKRLIDVNVEAWMYFPIEYRITDKKIKRAVDCVHFHPTSVWKLYENAFCTSGVAH